MDWPVVMGGVGDAVVTGSRVLERRLRVMGTVRERTLIMSRGPKASRAWKPGKRRTPMRKGGVVVAVVDSVAVECLGCVCGTRGFYVYGWNGIPLMMFFVFLEV